jgi:hypothetical protein
MRPPENGTAAPSGIGNGGNSKGLATRGTYPTAMDFAIAAIARRHRLDFHVASVICELADIGGRASA